MVKDRPKPQLYRIVRFYRHRATQARKVIKRHVTLEEAQRHCNDPATRHEGKTSDWFDGYQKEDS